MTRPIITILFFFCFCLLTPLFLPAMDVTGTVSGVVRDPQEASVPGAQILLRATNTGRTWEQTTDGKGRFIILGVPPGPYQVECRLLGFETAQSGELVLAVGQEATVHLHLKVGGLRSSLEVSGRLETVETSQASQSSVVDGRVLRELPLDGRDLGQLVLLQPGVVWAPTSVQSSHTGRGTRFSVWGARPNHNLFILDGAILNDALNYTPGGAQGLLLGVETVDEFRLLASNYSAEYGRVAGGIFLAVTKSGGNHWHGSAFEFLRNDALDARSYFETDVPEFRRNQFGGTLGGPLRRGKTFFFGGYEGIREYKGITRVSLVPDEEARQGRLPGQPPLQVDPRSQPILDLYPTSNGHPLGDGTAEYVGTTARPARGDFFTLRLDHQLSARHEWFARYLWDDSNQVLPRYFPEFPNLIVTRKQAITLTDKFTFSSTAYQEISFTYNRSAPRELMPDPNRSFQLVSGHPVGEINAGGLSPVGTDRIGPDRHVQNDFQLSEGLTLQRGRHSPKLGALLERFQNNGFTVARYNGQLRFRSLRDLILFRVQDLQVASADSDYNRGFRQWLAAGYLQDDIRLHPRFTLNLGLRYELVTSPGEVNGKIANLREILDPAVTLGGPYFVPPKWNFAPRFGWAASLSGDGKTALRGGWGMFHILPLYYSFMNPGYRSLPYANRVRLSGSDVTSLPVDLARLPGGSLATESIQANLEPSYAMQFNLNLQREILPRTLVSIAYVGSRGVNLMGSSDANTAIPLELPSGESYFPAGSARRNPRFDVVRRFYQGFNSNFHSLNLTVSGPVLPGLQLQGTYTWGKSIDDFSGNGRQSWSNGQARGFDPYRRYLDRGRSNFDTRRRLTLNGTFTLPSSGKGNGWLRLLARNWQAAGLWMYYSGFPFTPMVSGDPDRDATDENAARPDLISGIPLKLPGGSTPEMWFNLAAFAPPRPGFRGTAGRNILTGPGFQTINASLARQIKVHEGVQIQLRLEVFNLFNQANFENPANSEDGEVLFLYNPGSTPLFQPVAGAGRIFSTLGNSREIQLGLKLIF